MRIQVPLVIEMDDAQVLRYAEIAGLLENEGVLRAASVVRDVQGYVLALVRDSAAFGEAGDGVRGADVTIKGR